jgi:saccharopine dehydrogenase-like NADP-dependent oxidoreductase
LVGCAHLELGGLDSVKILVGGMPQTPPAVFKHAVYFNPSDLLAEYVRPARARRSGMDIAPHPLDAEIETLKDEDLGTLEAFLSDGLRTLLTSFPDVPTMNELTLRWPGHLDTMRNLRELGILESADTINAVAKALGERFFADAYPDVLLMIVEAIKGKERRVWRLIDRRLNSESAMSRTTGFTTAAVAMVLAKKQFTEPGVHPPERLGSPEIANAIIADLASFNVRVSELSANKV